MKKFFVILLAVIIVFLGILLMVPFFFKDTLLNLLDREIQKNVKAEVYFDREDIGLSLVRNFPNLTISLNSIGVVGVDQFQGDTLVNIDNFRIAVNLLSLFRGDQIKLTSVDLINPEVMVLILEDGTANYDIMRESVETGAQDTVSGEMNIGIDRWSIRNGKIGYFDQSSDVIATMEGVDHTGSGDFTATVFDMVTSTLIDKLMVRYGDVTYIQDKTFKADMTLNMDLDQSRYTLKENKISLNDFSFGLDGYVQVAEDAYEMDLTFEGMDNTIKSLLSLIPGAYKQGYEQVTAEGDLNFAGSIKGVYQETNPDLPGFHLSLNANNGSLQYPDLPEAIRNIRIDMTVDNPGAEFDQTKINVSSFHLDLGKNPVDAVLKINNLVNYDMLADIKANLDLGDVIRIYPLEKTELSGNVQLDVHIEGAYDSVRNTIPVSGKMDVRQLSYSGPDLPMDFQIQQANAVLDEKNMSLNRFDGQLGNTDLKMSGHLNNYMAFILEENMPLQGEFDLRSTLVDLNEWMADGETPEESPEDTTGLKVVKIPENLDFVLRSEMDLVKYEKLELKGVSGILRIKNGMLSLEDLDFNTLGGDFMVDGIYDTRDMDHPSYDLELEIKKLSIPKAYDAFFTVKSLAPIANLMEGNFSTDFKLSGELKPNMMPDLGTISGSGVLEILNAALKGTDSEIVTGITGLTRLSPESTNVTLKDVIMSTQITDGRVLVEPFSINFGGNKAVVAGSHGLDGSLDYRISLDIPESLAQSASSLVASATGKNLDLEGKDLKLNLGVGGTYKKPAIKILGADSGGTEAAAKEALKAVVDEEKEKLTGEAEKKLDEEADKFLGQAIDTVENKEIKEEVDKAKEALKSLFRKKEK